MNKKLSSISVFALAMLITGAVDGVGLATLDMHDDVSEQCIFACTGLMKGCSQCEDSKHHSHFM